MSERNDLGSAISPRSRPPLLVVGCPRSGTSIVSRLLVEHGLCTAVDSRRHNRYPDGYFEHLPVVMFHRAMELYPRRNSTSRGIHAIKTEPFLTPEMLQDDVVRGWFREAFRPLDKAVVDFLKFPPLALSLDLLLEHYPQARVLGVWRRPSTTFRSLVLNELGGLRCADSLPRAILLWCLYAAHLVDAVDRHPARVSLLEIDNFIVGDRSLTPYLASIGYSSDWRTASSVIPRSRWRLSPGPWWSSLYLIARAASVLIAAARPELRRFVHVRRWEGRLREATRWPERRRSRDENLVP